MQRSTNVRFLGTVLLIALAPGSNCVAQSASSPVDREPAPHIVQPPRDVGEYYPPASLRLGETGRVVLRFTVTADGKAVEPFRVDKEQSLSPSERLTVAAADYLKDARFVGPMPAGRVLTASFVFELAPCGTLGHGPVHDYTVNLCRDPPPPPDVQNPGVALSTD